MLGALADGALENLTITATWVSATSFSLALAAGAPMCGKRALRKEASIRSTKFGAVTAVSFEIGFAKAPWRFTGKTAPTLFGFVVVLIKGITKIVVVVRVTNGQSGVRPGVLLG